MTGTNGPSPLPLLPVTFDVAVDVARYFVASMRDARCAMRDADAPAMSVDEVWIDAELGMCVRHRRAGLRLGRRIGDVARDLVSMGDQLTTATQGAVLYHTMFDTPDPAELDGAFGDQRGYVWWGWAPAKGWAAVDAPDRLATVFRRAPGARATVDG